MKVAKKHLWKAALLVLPMAFLAANGQNSNGLEVGDYVDVWTTYGIVKIMQNQRPAAEATYYDLGDTLRISMMRGETEGGQIVLSATQNVGSYNLEAADLSDGNGNVISKDQIDVYHAKYQKIVSKTRFNTNDAFLVGDYIPDMLLDMDIAVEYKENKINKNENQSVYIDVTTPDDAVPGTYTGNFTLTVAGKTAQVPVVVTVWDICYEGKSDFQTIFDMHTNKVAMGEFDCTNDIFVRYQEAALKYNVSLFPIKGNYDGYLTEQVPVWFEDDRYNTIAVPAFSISDSFYTYNDSGNVTASAQSYINWIKNIVDISTPEKPYIKHAVCYHIGMDEADVHVYRWQQAERIYGEGGEVDKLFAEALKQLEEEGYYDKWSDNPQFVEELKHYVQYMEQVFVVTSFTEAAVSTFTSATFCPLISCFNDMTQVDRYNEGADLNNDGQLWSYSCNMPAYPHQAFHTDDYNIGTRLLGWMGKDYGFSGYLYYAVDQYAGAHTDDYVDIYDTAHKGAYANGDGYLFYPGYRYGSEYPFASNRLAAFREAVDDYDMLCVLEDLLNEYTAKYGIAPIALNDYVSDLYASLYTGSDYYNDDSLVYEAREELVRRIYALQKDGILATSDYSSGANKTTVYSTNATLQLNGTTYNGTAIGGSTGGYVYEVPAAAVQNGKLTITANETEWTYAAYSVKKLDLSAATVTEDSTATKNGNTLDLVMKSVDTGNDNSNMRKKIYVQFAAGDVAAFNSFSFTITNKMDKGFSADVVAVLKNGVRKIIGGVYVRPNQETTVRSYVGAELGLDVTEIQYFRLEFDNMILDKNKNSVLFGQYTFSLRDVVYDY